MPLPTWDGLFLCRGRRVGRYSIEAFGFDWTLEDLQVPIHFVFRAHKTDDEIVSARVRFGLKHRGQLTDWRKRTCYFGSPNEPLIVPRGVSWFRDVAYGSLADDLIRR